MSSKQGTLYIISAPSGAGKTSLVQAVVNQADHLVISISHTTRPPRPGEIDGVNYHFVSTEQFQSLLKEDIFLEHAQVFGHYYGTSRDWVSQQLQQNKDVILEIDWQGALQVRQQFPMAIGIFIVPPSLEVLRARLQERAQDSEGVIAKRMRQAQAEISHYPEFDYLIVNDEFAVAVNDLISVIKAHRLTLDRQAMVHQKLLERLLSV